MDLIFFVSLRLCNKESLNVGTLHPAHDSGKQGEIKIVPVFTRILAHWALDIA